jgi:hypothetical protein
LLAVSEFRPTPEQISDYVGAYRSEEIEPVYRIGVQDGVLILRRSKHDPDKLVLNVADYFGSSLGACISFATLPGGLRDSC